MTASVLGCGTHWGQVHADQRTDWVSVAFGESVDLRPIHVALVIEMLSCHPAFEDSRETKTPRTMNPMAGLLH